MAPEMLEEQPSEMAQAVEASGEFEVIHLPKLRIPLGKPAVSPACNDDSHDQESAKAKSTNDSDSSSPYSPFTPRRAITEGNASAPTTGMTAGTLAGMASVAAGGVLPRHTENPSGSPTRRRWQQPQPTVMAGRAGMSPLAPRLQTATSLDTSEVEPTAVRLPSPKPSSWTILGGSIFSRRKTSSVSLDVVNSVAIDLEKTSPSSASSSRRRADSPSSRQAAAPGFYSRLPGTAASMQSFSGRFSSSSGVGIASERNANFPGTSASLPSVPPVPHATLRSSSSLPLLQSGKGGGPLSTSGGSGSNSSPGSSSSSPNLFKDGEKLHGKGLVGKNGSPPVGELKKKGSFFWKPKEGYPVDHLVCAEYSCLITKYVWRALISQSAWGSINECASRETGDTYACKSFRKTHLVDKEKVDSVLNEIRAMLLVKGHPNIVELHDVLEDDQRIHMVMELMQGGDLLDRMNQRRLFPERATAKLCQALVSALAHCHKLGVVHRDVKPENILLVTPFSDSEVKLIDFGIAVLPPGGKLKKDVVGSLPYISPEALRGRVTPASDLWSVGIILFCMLFSSHPFWAATDSELVARVKKEELRFPASSSVSADAREVLTGLLRKNPAERLTAEEVLAHPWIREHADATRTTL